MRKMNLVCVGNGMVGQRFLEELVSRVSSDTVDMTVFCEEPRPAYDRVQLTSFFSGKSAIDLNVVPARFFEDKAITLRLNDRVVAIDRRRKIVTLGALQRRAVRQAGARHRLLSLRAADSGTRPPRLLRLSHHRGPRSDRRRRAARDASAR